MNKKILYRLSVDTAILLFTIALMAYTLAGNELHELLGILFFALYFLHQALNIRWYRALFKGTYTFRRSLNTTVDIILFAEVLALMISGVMISESIMPFLNFGSVSVGRTIHTLASHWYLMLVSIHLGLHLEMIFTALLNVSRKRNANKKECLLLKSFSVTVAIWGIVSFIRRGVWEKLTLYSSFPFFNNSDTWGMVFVEFGAIIWLVAFVSHYAHGLLLRKTSSH